MVRSESGITIVELLVAVSISALLMGSAVIQYSEISDSFNRQDAKQHVEADIARARAEALSEGALGILSIASNGKSYSVGFDRLPYSSPPSPDETFFIHELPNKITFGTSNSIIFNSRGYLVDETLQLSNSTLQFYDDGTEFCTAQISAAGQTQFLCDEG